MFCQVKVSPIHRDFLKFLWWKDGDYNQPVEVYHMSVHPFEATSSPSCAGLCLRKTADEFESEFDPETIETIRRNFYVDDCLKSVSDKQKAIRLIQQLRDILMRRSFRLINEVCEQRRSGFAVSTRKRTCRVCCQPRPRTRRTPGRKSSWGTMECIGRCLQFSYRQQKEGSDP
jgi:hypothetical protein